MSCAHQRISEAWQQSEGRENRNVHGSNGCDGSLRTRHVLPKLPVKETLLTRHPHDISFLSDPQFTLLMHTEVELRAWKMAACSPVNIL